MLGPGSVARWFGNLMLRRAMAKGDLASLRRIPGHVTVPLQRRGLDPVPEIARRRETEPVSRLTKVLGMSVWMVSGYDECRAVLADTSRYSNDVRGLVGRADAEGADAIGGLGFTDPPEHTRLRKVLTPEFTKRRLSRLEPRIDEIVEHHLDLLEERGPTTDLVEHFAFAVPFHVICELLGLPLERRDDFFMNLGSARFDLSEGIPGLFGSMVESREFLIDAVKRQRVSPGDGLIGALIRDHGDEFDDIELGGLADGVFTGGYETSASMLALGALTLVQNPDAGDLVRDPVTLDQVVEEMLRYLTVVQVAFPRFATVDHELFGQQIRAGDLVSCSLSGANRDHQFRPARAALPVGPPDVFDARRTDGPSHLTFGHGFHRCVGAELARMELRAGYRGLATRFPDMRLAVPQGSLAFRELSFVFGVEALPVHLYGQTGVRPAGTPGADTHRTGTDEAIGV